MNNCEELTKDNNCFDLFRPIFCHQGGPQILVYNNRCHAKAKVFFRLIAEI